MPINNQIMIQALPAFIFLTALEAYVLTREHRNPETKQNAMVSLGLGIIFTVSAFISKGLLFVVYSWLYQFRIIDITHFSWWVWALCFVGDDFSYYWFHRCSHSIRYLWACHLVHHSSETYNLMAAFRNSFFAQLNGSFIFWCWLPIVGFRPDIIIFAKTMSTIYQFLLHTEVIHKFPAWFEYIFNTPSHHRVHHGSNEEYLDKNHGGWLIIFDRILGTYLDESFHPTYGLTKKIPGNNPVYINVAEYISIYSDLKKVRGFRNYWKCIFGPPSWKPEESSIKAKYRKTEKPNLMTAA